MIKDLVSGKLKPKELPFIQVCILDDGLFTQLITEDYTVIKK